MNRLKLSLDCKIQPSANQGLTGNWIFRQLIPIYKANILLEITNMACYILKMLFCAYLKIFWDSIEKLTTV